MDDIYAMPGHQVRRLQQIAVAIFLAETGRMGLDLTPVQYAALATIRARPGLDQATLAGLIAYDRATIGGVVDRLVQKGRVVRIVNGRDRRARELRLTDDGESLLQTAGPAVARVQERLLSGLDADERDQFMRLLVKATTAINEYSRAPLSSSAPRPGQ